MSTIRRRLRDACIATLSGTPGVTSVIRPPGRQLAAAELTALVVEVGAETARTASKASTALLLARNPTLTVTALILDGSTADDAIEALWGEVEARLATDWTFGGLIKEVRSMNLGAKLFDDFAERRFAVAQPAMEQSLSLECVFYAQFGQPDVAR